MGKKANVYCPFSVEMVVLGAYILYNTTAINSNSWLPVDFLEKTNTLNEVLAMTYITINNIEKLSSIKIQLLSI